MQQHHNIDYPIGVLTVQSIKKIKIKFLDNFILILLLKCNFSYGTNFILKIVQYFLATKEKALLIPAHGFLSIKLKIKTQNIMIFFHVEFEAYNSV